MSFLRLNVVVPFLGTLVTFILAIFVLSRDSQNEVNKSFCFLGIALAIFNLKALLLQFAPSAELAVLWVKVFQPGTVFILPTFFSFRPGPHQRPHQAKQKGAAGRLYLQPLAAAGDLDRLPSCRG